MGEESRITAETDAIMAALAASQLPLDAVDSEIPRLDIETALDNLGGEIDLYIEVIEVFLTESLTQLESLKAALAGPDLVGARRAAHSLKGMAASVGAELLSQQAARLEAACKAQDATAVASTAPAVIEEVPLTNEVLRTYVASHPTT